VELGTNGSVTSADFDAMMQASAGVKRVVFVNLDVPRSWEAPDNAVLAAGVARYPGVAVLADWYTLSTPHPEWFTADQVHLNPDGAQAMATLITQSIRPPFTPPATDPRVPAPGSPAPTRTRQPGRRRAER